MTEIDKPFAPSCDRNKEPILEVMKKYLRPEDKAILEVGSGTGQHAVYFAEQLSNLTWQTSDMLENHDGIQAWLNEAKLRHVISPLEYQIGKSDWPKGSFDVVYTANTLHIMSFELVKIFINDLGQNLSKGNRVMIYGPFKYQGQFTSESNAEFEVWLQDIDPLRGIRDFEVIDHLMNKASLILIEDVAMPANNQMLIYELK